MSNFNYDRNNRNDQDDRNDQNRNNRGDRNNRGYQGDRNNRSYQGDRNNRGDQGDRNNGGDRNDRYNNNMTKHDGSFHRVPRNHKPFNSQSQNDRPYYFQNNNSQQNQPEDNQLNDFGTKKEILSYVYNTIELSNYKYKLVEYEYDLGLIKEKKYYVSPNYNGIHSLLIFVKIRNQFLSFIIDRKTLTYNINQIDYDKVKIIPIYHRFDEEIYKGTIFDGVLLYNNIDGMKNFVINDIYYLRGKHLSDDKISNKMLNITTYLDSVNQIAKTDTKMNNIVFIVNKLYELKDIQQLVNVYIPKSKYNKSIKGITFYPEFSGTKLIYLYNNCSLDKEPNANTKSDIASHAPIIPTTDYSSDIIEKPQKAIVKSNINVDNLTAIFRMKQTETIDVYNLFIGEKYNEGDKKLFKYKKIGIAFIPTKECSHFCKEAFEQANDDTILVECKYDVTKKRWEPIKVADNKKRPDLIEKIQAVLE